eukprot:g2673.t1
MITSMRYETVKYVDVPSLHSLLGITLRLMRDPRASDHLGRRGILPLLLRSPWRSTFTGVSFYIRSIAERILIQPEYLQRQMECVIRDYFTFMMENNERPNSQTAAHQKFLISERSFLGNLGTLATRHPIIFCKAARSTLEYVRTNLDGHVRMFRLKESTNSINGTVENEEPLTKGSCDESNHRSKEKMRERSDAAKNAPDDEINKGESAAKTDSEASIRRPNEFKSAVASEERKQSAALRDEIVMHEILESLLHAFSRMQKKLFGADRTGAMKPSDASANDARVKAESGDNIAAPHDYCDAATKAPVSKGNKSSRRDVMSLTGKLLKMASHLLRQFPSCMRLILRLNVEIDSNGVLSVRDADADKRSSDDEKNTSMRSMPFIRFLLLNLVPFSLQYLVPNKKNDAEVLSECMKISRRSARILTTLCSISHEVDDNGKQESKFQDLTKEHRTLSARVERAVVSELAKLLRDENPTSTLGIIESHSNDDVHFALSCRFHWASLATSLLQERSPSMGIRGLSCQVAASMQDANMIRALVTALKHANMHEKGAAEMVSMLLRPLEGLTRPNLLHAAKEYREKISISKSAGRLSSNMSDGHDEVVNAADEIGYYLIDDDDASPVYGDISDDEDPFDDMTDTDEEDDEIDDDIIDVDDDDESVEYFEGDEEDDVHSDCDSYDEEDTDDVDDNDDDDDDEEEGMEEEGDAPMISVVVNESPEGIGFFRDAYSVEDDSGDESYVSTPRNSIIVVEDVAGNEHYVTDRDMDRGIHLSDVNRDDIGYYDNAANIRNLESASEVAISGSATTRTHSEDEDEEEEEEIQAMLSREEEGVIERRVMDDEDLATSAPNGNVRRTVQAALGNFGIEMSRHAARMDRRAPTSSAPSFTSIERLDSSGAPVEMLTFTPGDGSGAFPDPSDPAMRISASREVGQSGRPDFGQLVQIAMNAMEMTASQRDSSSRNRNEPQGSRLVVHVHGPGGSLEERHLEVGEEFIFDAPSSSRRATHSRRGGRSGMPPHPLLPPRPPSRTIVGASRRALRGGGDVSAQTFYPGTASAARSLDEMRRSSTVQHRRRSGSTSGVNPVVQNLEGGNHIVVRANIVGEDGGILMPTALDVERRDSMRSGSQKSKNGGLVPGMNASIPWINPIDEAYGTEIVMSTRFLQMLRSFVDVSANITDAEGVAERRSTDLRDTDTANLSGNHEVAVAASEEVESVDHGSVANLSAPIDNEESSDILPVLHTNSRTHSEETKEEDISVSDSAEVATNVSTTIDVPDGVDRDSVLIPVVRRVDAESKDEDREEASSKEPDAENASATSTSVPANAIDASAAINLVATGCASNYVALLGGMQNLLTSLVKSSASRLSEVSPVLRRMVQRASMSSPDGLDARECLLVPSNGEVKLALAMRALVVLCDRYRPQRHVSEGNTSDWEYSLSKLDLDHLWKPLYDCLDQLYRSRQLRPKMKDDSTDSASKTSTFDTPTPLSRSMSRQNSPITTPKTPESAESSLWRLVLLRFSPAIKSFFIAHTPLGLKALSQCKNTMSDVASSSRPTATSTQIVPSEVSATPPLLESQGRVVLLDFVKKHQILINELVRASPFQLLEHDLRIMTHPPARHFLEFDNKRSFFRARLKASRARNGPQPSAINITVRREHIMFDSFVQLSKRSAREMQGRLRVTFEGEDGVDAGGLTREWYSVLAREIFNPNYGLFIKSHDSPTYQASNVISETK